MPEKLSSVCVAGALRDGLCAYTALHTHARMAAGHTLLVMDGASVRNNTGELNVFVWSTSSEVRLRRSGCSLTVISSLLSVFWPHVHPAGLLPRGEGSDDGPLATETHLPGAAPAQRRSVRANSMMSADFTKLWWLI